MRRLVPILALGAALLPLAGLAAAASSNPANQARLESTVRYLQGVQNDDGGFGGATGGESGQMFSAWVALALAAAGINPQDQASPGGLDVYSYLESNYHEGIAESDCAPIVCTTTFERELMVVNASGTDPRRFAGVDLVAELLDRARPDGSFPHVPGGQPGVNDTIFAIFALAPVQESVAQAVVQPAADWIEAAQHANGGWAWSATSTRDEVDMTGAAIQALAAAGRSGGAAVRDGLAYLRAAQNPDGGFPEYPGNPESNVASTAWAVQGVWAAGEDPEAWLTGSGGATEEPLDFMESLQAPDGHIRWKQSTDANGVWMTAYVAPAFAGQAWPIPAAPRAKRATPLSQPGTGGGTQSGDGVMAGGGGRGAPLFSRPKPQSRGRIPGGARVLRNGGVPAADRDDTRRGRNTEQPTWTQRSEPESSSAEAEEGAAEEDSARAAQGTRPGGEGGAGGRLRQLRALAAAGAGSPLPGGGQEVTGALIGSQLAFGAPGLDGAGEDEEEAVALGIGAAALLLALGGARWERRRQEALL